MFHVDRRGWSEIKGVEIKVRIVVRGKGCEVRVVVYIEYSYRVK